MQPIAPSLRWFAIAAILAAGVGLFWAFDSLPFQDLPAHAGLIALRHRLAESPLDQRFFVLAPRLGPYSLFRWAGDRLVEPLGPLGSVRLLASLPVVALPLALGWARQRLHGDGARGATCAGICLSFGFMTLLGFASYMLGLAALVVAYGLWVDGLGRPRGRTWRRECAIALAALTVLFTHGFAFVVFVGLACVTSVACGIDRHAFRRLRALLPSAVMAAFMVGRDCAHGPAGTSAGMPAGPHFAGLLDKASLLLGATLMTRWGPDLIVGVLLWVLVGVTAARTARRYATSARGMALAPPRMRAALAALALLGAAFLALPRSVGWFGFIDGRLVPIVLVVGLLAAEREAMSARLRIAWEVGLPAGAAAIVATAWAASWRFQAEAAGWHRVLGSVPAGARLLNLPLDADSNVFTAHPFVHYDKLAILDRPLLVSDIWFHQGTAIYPRADNPSLRLPPEYRESDLQRIDWASYRLEDWDYVLVRTRPRAARPETPPSLEDSAHVGGWWLFATRRGRGGDGAEAGRSSDK
jgi:hypothetical protein